MLYIWVVALLLANVCEVKCAPKEIMRKRASLLKRSQTDTALEHEVVFAIKANNLDVLEAEVLEMATPGTLKYQKWMTYDEVSNLVSNEESASHVQSWLETQNIKVCILYFT